MAVPHASGVIAAFLSVRREFTGRPDLVKQIFLDTATDLKRTRTFQGRGLIDLTRRTIRRSASPMRWRQDKQRAQVYGNLSY
jgi:hypothetical protein